MDFETRAIHDGQEPDSATGAVTVPIYQTSTYVQDAVGEHKGYDYSRVANPTRTALQSCLASLEGAAHGIAFSSGIGAVSTLMHLVNPAERVVLIADVYGGVYRMTSQVYEPKGYVFDYLPAAAFEDLGAHLDEQPAALVDEGDGPDLLGGVGDLAVQPDPQRRAPLGGHKPHPAALDGERAVPEPHRHHPAFPTRETRADVAVLAAFGGGEPGVTVAAQHPFGADRGQLPEHTRPGPVQLTAQGLEVHDARQTALASPSVHVQQTRPHIPGRHQQSETPASLPGRDTQTNPGGPHHHPGPTTVTTPRHQMTTPRAHDKTTRTTGRTLVDAALGPLGEGLPVFGPMWPWSLAG